MLEKHLKYWLNAAYGGNVKFIEPTWGSSIGMPDVEVPVGSRTMPVELKIGTMRNESIRLYNLRPSQARYHIMESERGNPTFIMVGIGEPTKFHVYMFSGKYVENDRYRDSENVLTVARNQRWTNQYDREALDEAFNFLIKRAGQ